MKDNELRLVFQKNLNTYMERNNTTQVELSKALNVSASAVSSWCLGEKLPRIDKIDAIANYLGIKRSDLLESRTLPESTGSAETIGMYLTPEEIELVESYRNSPDAIKAATLAVAKTALEKKTSKSKRDK